MFLLSPAAASWTLIILSLLPQGHSSLLSGLQEQQQPDIAGPKIFTGNASIDDAHYLALVEVSQNVAPDRTHFLAGHGWTQLWTRDVSYAAEQAASVLYPDVVRFSLESSVEYVQLDKDDEDNEYVPVWLQDSCQHFGGWPNLSDAIVGARGAWSLYKVEQNTTFLSWAYQVTKNSLIRAEQDVYDSESGLFRGCSSFMESNSGYPWGYRDNGEAVGKTKALSTNVLYYSGYEIAALMGQKLGESEEEIVEFQSKAEELKSAIQSRFWLPNRGYYAYFEDEKAGLVHQMEGLGESLALLDFEDDQERIQSIFTNIEPTEYGLPCLSPQFYLGPRRSVQTYYHNGLLWPFVQGYWAAAAAKHREIDVFANALMKLTELAINSQTFAEFYDLDGTFLPGRKRQLWSATGYLAMIYQGLFGMSYTADGIRFAAIKPSTMMIEGRILLKGLKYHKMVLDISVEGYGANVEEFLLDETAVIEPFVSSDLIGKHSVTIKLR